MSWTEKIDKAEGLQKQMAEAEKRQREKRWLQLLKEYTPPLVQTLQNLGVKDMLDGIRLEEWRLGEIKTLDSLSSPDYGRNTMGAEIILEAKWATLSREYIEGDYDSGKPGHDVYHQENVVHSLGIAAQWNFCNPDEKYKIIGGTREYSIYHIPETDITYTEESELVTNLRARIALVGNQRRIMFFGLDFYNEEHSYKRYERRPRKLYLCVTADNPNTKKIIEDILVQQCLIRRRLEIIPHLLKQQDEKYRETILRMQNESKKPKRWWQR